MGKRNGCFGAAINLGSKNTDRTKGGRKTVVTLETLCPMEVGLRARKTTGLGKRGLPSPLGSKNLNEKK